MSRARSIKHGFFLNDDLAKCSPLARLLFAGLWCLADREGRLEDRPVKIKAQLLPYDDCNCDDLLTELADRHFILRYQAEGENFIQVANFVKHQRPHPKEPKSVIPGPNSSNREKTFLDAADCAIPSLPSIPSHTPKSPDGEGACVSQNQNRKSTQSIGAEPSGTTVSDAGFERFWKAFPRKTDKHKALGAWKKLNPSADMQELLLKALDRQRLTDQWQRGFYPHASTWLNGKRWEDEDPPAMNGQPQKTPEERRAEIDRANREEQERLGTRTKGRLTIRNGEAS